jgi:hypothetical protein
LPASRQIMKPRSRRGRPPGRAAGNPTTSLPQPRLGPPRRARTQPRSPQTTLTRLRPSGNQAAALQRPPAPAVGPNRPGCQPGNGSRVEAASAAL